MQLSSSTQRLDGGTKSKAGSVAALASQTEPKKFGSSNMLAASRQTLLKDVKLKNKQNALQYKLRKQAEGLESEREPDVSGIMKWVWSKR